MNIIQTVTDWLRPKASYGPLDDFWFTPLYQNGEVFRITPENSLKITAVYACIRILADTIASLPLDLYKHIEGGKELAQEHYLYEMLKYQPNQNQDAFQFFERVMIDCNTRGVFYAEKVFKGGRIAELRPLLADYMQISRIPHGGLRYEYQDPATNKPKIYRPDQLFRVQLFTGPDGFTPISPIRYNADAIGITESTEKYAGSFFRNSAKPSGQLVTPDGVKLKPEDAKAMAESWNRAYQGPDKAHKTAVLDQGVKFMPISLSNQDSQLLESRRFQLADIARIYRVPLHMIQELERSTFNNIEHQSLDFAIHTIRPWCRRIQHAIRRDLLFENEKSEYFAEFNLNDLMSADAKSRGEFYASAVTNGYMTRNEVRARENLNPIEGLDEPLQPMNMATQEEKERQMQLQEKQAAAKPQNNGADKKDA